MKILPIPFSIIDWSRIAVMERPSDAGLATWQTQDFGDIRVRMVEYSPGYSADHWCSKGHVVLCLAGSLEIRLADGTQRELKAGQSYVVGDGDPPHRSSTREGAKLFIVD